MATLKAILTFLSGLMNFGKWFTDRKDVRAEKASKVEAVKKSDQDAAAIRNHYDKYRK